MNLKISKISLLIIVLFSFTPLISGCIGDNNNNNNNNSASNLMIKPGFGVLGDSEFDLESGWSQKPISGNGYEVNFNYNQTNSKNVIFMRVNQFKDKLKFEEDFVTSSQSTSIWSVLSSATENIEGVNVKTIKLSRNDDTETIKYYFFEKNGKYYKVLIDIGGTSGAQSYFNSNKDLLDSTLTKIVRTIH